MLSRYCLVYIFCRLGFPNTELCRCACNKMMKLCYNYLAKIHVLLELTTSPNKSVSFRSLSGRHSSFENCMNLEVQRVAGLQFFLRRSCIGTCHFLVRIEHKTIQLCHPFPQVEHLLTLNGDVELLYFTYPMHVVRGWSKTDTQEVMAAIS
jgi:hypothetical protein